MFQTRWTRAFTLGGIVLGTSIGVQAWVSKGLAKALHPSPVSLSTEMGINLAQAPSEPSAEPGSVSPSDAEVLPDGDRPVTVEPSASTEGQDAVSPDILLNPTPSASDAPLHVGNPPARLVNILRRIDRAASNENLPVVMNFFSPDLQHSDGLTTQELEGMLTAFWAIHDDLSYSTQITDWERTESGFTTTTITTIMGQQSFGSEPLMLTATIESRQRIENRQIVEQEILSEQSQVQSGDTPPTVEVNLSDAVTIGQPFFFDAIVLEPIGESLLMGSAFSHPVSLENYTTVPMLDLEILGAGGLFKVGKASLSPGQEWISGVIIREDGITGVTQRLHVVNMSEL